MRIHKLFPLTLLIASVASAQSWQPETSGTTAGLRGVHVVSDGVVWASGTKGTILRSTDAGSSWQQCATPPGAGAFDFRGIWAFSDQSAFVMSSGDGDQSRLYKTNDGCKSWTLTLTNPDADQDAGYRGFWDGLFFLDPRQGFVIGDAVRGAEGTDVLPLQRTRDGGKTWSHRKPIPAEHGEGFFAASNSSMTASGDTLWLGTTHSRVLRSTDGETWQSAPVPLASGNASSGVFSLAFRDLKHGVAVGGDYRSPEQSNGTAAFTADGGEHWTVATKPPHGFRSAVAWDGAHHAWITVGTNGSDISYDDGQTWQWLDSGNWNALGLPWAVGPNGQIGKLTKLPPPPTPAGSVSR